MQNKIERVTPTTIIVGIDAAKETHWARMTDWRGIDLTRPFKIQNSMEGFESLLSRIEKQQSKTGCDHVMIGIEPSSVYWKPLAWYLKLHESKPMVVGVNPYHTKQAKELDDNTQEKSDPKDAQTIAHLVRDGRYFDIYMPQNEYSELRVLTAERKRLQKEISRVNNIIVAIMDEYFPEYGKVFSNTTCKTSRQLLLKCPFPSDVLSMNQEELVKLVKIASNGAQGAKLTESLIEAAKNSVGVGYGKTSIRIRLKNLTDELALFEQQKADVETQMTGVMQSLELSGVLQSMKGIGPVISATFIGEIGDVNRFDHWKQVRKLAGCNLVEQSSGTHKGRSKISKRGRPYLRYMLYMAGEACLLHNDELRQYYQYLRERRNNPLNYNQAIVATGLKAMRIMFHMAKTGEKYDPAKALGPVRLEQIKSLAA